MSQSEKTTTDLEELVQELRTGETLRLRWGEKTRLKVDRRLPFLCLYRAPGLPDEGTRALLTSEASCLEVGPGEDARPLVETVVSAQQPAFGAFLLLELWAGPPLLEPYTIAQFTIHTGGHPTVERLAETMSGRLRRLKLSVPAIITQTDQKPWPSDRPRILGRQWCEENHCLRLGLEISPFYQSTAGKPYPIILRSLRRKLGRVLRQTLYEFVTTSTPLAPPNYQTLGPRAMVKLVWQVDQALEEVSNSFSFLLQATPINTHQAWLRFKKAGYDQDPEFLYRPFPHDPTQLKRQLFAVPVDRVEEPTLARLFLEKQHQLDTKITMLGRRRTPHFLYGSLSLYGAVDDELRAVARQLLEVLPQRAREADPKLVEADEFAQLARDEIEFYRQQWEGFTPRVEVREDLGNGILCDRGHLLIGSRAQVAASRVQPLLHHEVGTHLLTYYNGRAQPLRQLALGLADYLAFQEGIAVLSEFLSGPLSRPRIRLLAVRVLAVDLLLSGATFSETFNRLRDQYALPAAGLFDIVTRVYRGGGLTKDAIYLRGLVSLLDFLRKGGDLEPLFVGKIARHHIPLIKELQWRRVLVRAPLKPRVLSEPQAQERLELLRSGISLPALVLSEAF